MPAQTQTSRKSRWRRALKWTVVLLVCLSGLLASTLFYLRSSGFPDFLKQQLESRLRARGLSIELGPVRLRGREILADRVRIAPADQASGPQAILDHVRMRLNGRALTQGRVQPESLAIAGGQVMWTRANTNGASHNLSLDNIVTALHLTADGRLELAQFQGQFRGAEVQVTASITNASAFRAWWTARRTAEPSTNRQGQIDRLLAALERLTLSPEATLHISLQGDGRAPDKIHADVHLKTPQARWKDHALENLDLRATTSTPPSGADALQLLLAVRLERAFNEHTELREIGLGAQWLGSVTNVLSGKADWQLRLAAAQAHSITGRTVVISGTTVPAEATPGPLRSQLIMQTAALDSPWGRSATNELRVDLTHGSNPRTPWRAKWHLTAGPVQSRWGELAHARVSGQLAPRDTAVNQPGADNAWGPWTKLEPFAFDWKGEFDQIQSPKLEAQTLSCAGQWQAPLLQVNALDAQLYEGQLSASAQLDVATREVQAKGAFNVNVHKVSGLLTKPAQRWISQFGWDVPPDVEAAIRLSLPAWTNRQPNWREDVMPTIQISGAFAGSDATFRGIPIAHARSHFALTNLVWHLPDLRVQRPDGEATLRYRGNMRTRDFRWDIDARVHPLALKPLFTEDAARRASDLFHFNEPPAFKGSVSGRWREPESVSLSGRLAATNFVFRGERCDRLNGDLAFTNMVLTFSNVTARQGTEEVRVPLGRFDLNERFVYLTNAISTMDPDLVTRVIGPKVRAAIRPYHFDKPPTVRVNGRLPTRKGQDADARFEVAGEQFCYWKIRAASIMGNIHWRGDYLSITNVHGSAYGGELVWRGNFDFTPPRGAQFSFQGILRQADLNSLMTDLTGNTNSLQGTLDGRLTITSANSADWDSWEGSGQVQLQDGFLWDIPIFGFFSPILNGIVPGLGNSPVSAGEASFRINRSIIRTSDLELWSPALRLQYAGKVDFKGNVDARVQAEILRDAWAVGRAISLALWPISKAFEYHVTDTLAKPQSEPVYIPKMFLWPLHPIRAIKRLFTPDRNKPPLQSTDNPFRTPKE